VSENAETTTAVPEPATTDPEPNLRVEEMIRRFGRRHRWILLGCVLGVVLLAGAICWARAGATDSSAAPQPTVDVVAAVQATLTAQAAPVAPETPETVQDTIDDEELSMLVEERAQQLSATRVAYQLLQPTSPPPALIPAKADAYTRYRYYHFLEEYRQCFADKNRVAAEAEPTPEPSPEPTPEPTPPPDVGGDGTAADAAAGNVPMDTLTPEPTPEPTPIPVRAEYDLEIETLRALPEAVAALLAMYDLGECEEPDDYAIYKGRGTWLRLWQ